MLRNTAQSQKRRKSRDRRQQVNAYYYYYYYYLSYLRKRTRRPMTIITLQLLPVWVCLDETSGISQTVHNDNIMMMAVTTRRVEVLATASVFRGRVRVR